MGHRPLLGSEVIRQTKFTLREGGHGLTTAVGMGAAAYLGVNVLILARVVIVLSGGKPEEILNEFPKLLLAEPIMEEHKGEARYANRKLVNTVESLSVALRLGNDLPNGKQIFRNTRPLRAGQRPPKRKENRRASTSSWLKECSHRRISCHAEEAEREDRKGTGHVRKRKSVKRERRRSQVCRRVRREDGSLVGVVLSSNVALHKNSTSTAARNSSSFLKTRATNTKWKQRLVGYQGAKGQGAIAWVTCQRKYPREQTTPDL